MERMTERFDGKVVRKGCHGPCSTCPGAECGDIYPMIDRLAAYEDTGLEPEEIERVLDAYGRGMTLREENCERLSIIRTIHTDRLKELARAEKDGCLVVLPVKVGDTVYIPSNDGVHGVRVMGIRISASGKDTVLHLDTGSGTFRWGSDKGRTWFPTQKEAEAALKKRGETGP